MTESRKHMKAGKQSFWNVFSTVWGVRFNARVGWDHRDLGYQVDYKTWIRQHPTTFWRFCIRGLDSKLWASAASCTLVASTCWSQWLWTPATRTIATSRGDNFAGACLWQRGRNIPQLSTFHHARELAMVGVLTCGSVSRSNCLAAHTHSSRRKPASFFGLVRCSGNCACPSHRKSVSHPYWRETTFIKHHFISLIGKQTQCEHRVPKRLR